MVFAETCRIIQFVRKVNEKALEGHTIATINSNNVDFVRSSVSLTTIASPITLGRLKTTLTHMYVN